VPHEHRGEVWWSILGGEARKAEAPIAYQDYVNQKLDGKVDEEIERDLLRTFPNHKLFRTVAGRSQLRNVLHALAAHAPLVQYCQGLNFIAAVLLMVFGCEERSFWALICAFDFLGVERYYTEGMPLLRADMRALAITLKRKCPKVANRLQKEGIDLTAICSEWFITWYAKSLPAPTVLRVWDALFFEGYKVFFRIAVGIFKRAEADILRCDFDQLMERGKLWARRQVEHNELLKASFGGMPPMRRRDLIRDRRAALTAIELEDRERRERIAAKHKSDASAKAVSSVAPSNRETAQDENR